MKTDAIDAEHLSTLLRLDAFTAVTVPDELTEAARDLVRAREDCRSDLMRARHRLSKLLLRHGIVYSGGQAWVGAHDAWLRRQRFDSPLVQAAFDEAYDSVVTITARRDRLDERIEAMAVNSKYTDVVRRLGCLRGISTLTGFGLAVEIGDWSRFTGNGHARRLLVEAAWHHQHRYVAGKTIRDRWDLASPAARARGDLGNRRLNHRWNQFKKRKKKSTIANTAIARELAGWCWSLAVLEEYPLEAHKLGPKTGRQGMTQRPERPAIHL